MASPKARSAPRRAAPITTANAKTTTFFMPSPLQLLQLIHQLPKPAQAPPSPLGSGFSISTPAPRKRSNGPLAAPTLQEPPNNHSTPAPHPSAPRSQKSRNRRTQPRRILIHIKRPIKMRNPQTLQLQLRINHKPALLPRLLPFRTKIKLQQLPILPTQQIHRQRLPLLHPAACVTFSNSANIVCRTIVPRISSIA